MPARGTAEELRNVWHECTGIYRRSVAAQQQFILRVFSTGQSQRTFLGFVRLQRVVLLLHFVMVQQLLLVVLGAVATSDRILTGLVALLRIWSIGGPGIPKFLNWQGSIGALRVGNSSFK